MIYKCSGLQKHGIRITDRMLFKEQSVLDVLGHLECEGFNVTYLDPRPTGEVDPQQVIEALRADTVLVSLMHVNNESGVIQDVARIGGVCRERGIVFHVDGAQSAGKPAIDVEAWGIDLMSLTAHKCYGPQASARTQPLIFGGGQEFGLRPDTLPTHQIVGMGAALALAELDTETARIRELRDLLWAGVATVAGTEWNGDPRQTVAGTLNVTFRDMQAETLQASLRGLAISAGSACSSGSANGSHVLRALGRTDQLAQSSLRFSLGRFTLRTKSILL